MPRDTPPLPSDGIYQAILVVMVASVLVGAVLALAGELLWHSPALSQAGTWLALVSGGVYAFFRIFGAREARLGSQTHALGFYEAFGFQAYGPEFVEADIPHQNMVLSL